MMDVRSVSRGRGLVFAALAAACSVDRDRYHLGIDEQHSAPSASGGAPVSPAGASGSGGQPSPSEGQAGDPGSATAGAAHDAAGAPGAGGNTHTGGASLGSPSPGGSTSGGIAESGAATGATASPPSPMGGSSPAAGGGGSNVRDGCDGELLENGNFDAGRTAWSESWNNGDPFQIIVPRSHARLSGAGVSPHDGDYLAWLGGIPDDEWNSHTTVLSQQIEIPADAARLTLTGYVWIRSLETPETKADFAVIELENEEGDIPWQIVLWNRDHATSEWVYFERSSTELDFLRGEQLAFVAKARTDLTEETSFWLDSLSFVSSCGQ